MKYETSDQIHDYEQRHSGFITAVGNKHVASSADIARLPSYQKAHGGILTGYATRYNKLIFHDGKQKILAPGAFSDWIKGGHTVRFLLAHDDDKCVGSTTDGLELVADHLGIAFRFRIPDTPLGREVQTLAQTEMLQGMSIGFCGMRVEYKTLDGQSVCLLHDGELHEISFLKSGAVGDAYCTLIDEKDCGATLAEDCARFPHRMGVGGLYVRTMREIARHR